VSRSERLLSLLQVLRRHRRPVSGQALADEMGISIRTLYRDIATLQGQGALIEGEPGLGYVLRPGFMLPPLMFSEEEIEAIVLGMRWVTERGDHPLRSAGRNALSKISSVLPDDLRRSADSSALIIGPSDADLTTAIDLAEVRQAIRSEHKLDISYADGSGTHSRRLIWPFALGFFDRVRIILGWCELRQDYRHFRADRIVGMTLTGVRYPRRRHALLKAWQEKEGISRLND
jgi:predicted DNA-binding transcriptional regulator YafY